MDPLALKKLVLFWPPCRKMNLASLPWGSRVRVHAPGRLWFQKHRLHCKCNHKHVFLLCKKCCFLCFLCALHFRSSILIQSLLTICVCHQNTLLLCLRLGQEEREAEATWSYLANKIPLSLNIKLHLKNVWNWKWIKGFWQTQPLLLQSLLIDICSFFIWKHQRNTGNKRVIVIMREHKSQHEVSNSTAAFDWKNSGFVTAISNGRKRDQANALWVCNDGK